MQTFDIDRKTASRLLKMSLRTVDRYIEAQKLSHERRSGRVWLDKKEISQLKAQRRVDIAKSRMSIDKMDLIPVDMSIDNDGNTFHSTENYSTNDDEFPQPQANRRRTSAGSGPNSHLRDQVDGKELELFKKLYEELQNDFKLKEQRLEAAQYRIGQLEAHLKETIPLLEYKRDLTQERNEKTRLRKDLDTRLMELDLEKNNAREEKFNKTVYLILLFILLILQPLWFLIPPR